MSFEKIMERVQEPCDHVIEIDLPDGRHWFYGMAMIGEGNGSMVMNDWRMNIADLKPRHGIWSQDECVRWLKYIATDGVNIKPYAEALKEQNRDDNR